MGFDDSDVRRVGILVPLTMGTVELAADGVARDDEPCFNVTAQLLKL